MLKEKIYNKIVINRECTIHDPETTSESLQGPTKLFNTIINSVKTARI